MTAVKEDEAENLDDNDEAVAAVVNCEFEDLPKQNKNEIPLEENILEGDPDEFDNM